MTAKRPNKAKKGTKPAPRADKPASTRGGRQKPSMPPPEALAGMMPRQQPEPASTDETVLVATEVNPPAELPHSVSTELPQSAGSGLAHELAAANDSNGTSSHEGGEAVVPTTESREEGAAPESAEITESAPAAPVPAPRASSRMLPPLDSSDEGNVDASMLETARGLLSTQFYMRQWGRIGMRNRSEEVDDFGYDPVYDARVRPFFQALYDRYFRVEVDNVGAIPAEGPCVLVANHSGILSLDAIMLKLAIRKEHAEKRELRWLAEDFVFHFPFLGSFSNRIGAVRACQENATRLLDQGKLVGVFPEGVKGIGKLYRDRYKLQRFGRGGFIKLCMRAGVPLVPVAIVGAEEMNPLIHRLEFLNKALGVPYVPVTPTFPLLGPLGLIPAPTKWRIRFGTPIPASEFRRANPDDELWVGRMAERVRATVQGMVDRMIGDRQSVFRG